MPAWQLRGVGWSGAVGASFERGATRSGSIVFAIVQPSPLTCFSSGLSADDVRVGEPSQSANARRRRSRYQGIAIPHVT
jgi:hypothetical protein